LEKCTQPDCGKEYKNKSGLASHMGFVHGMTIEGELLPEGSIEKRKQALKNVMRNTHAGRTAAHTPEARAKAAHTTRERHFAKLKEQGIFRCPECWDTSHRKVEFSTPTELGKHRRFKHGVLGRSQTAEKMQRRAAANEAKTKTANGFQCPQCSRSFPKQHGLSIHITQAHKNLALTPSTSQELTNGNGSTQGTTNGHQKPKANRAGSYDDAAFAETLAVSNLAGKLEGIILTASAEFDIAPRQLARRVILALGEHYS
jgi:hypothetical protein